MDIVTSAMVLILPAAVLSMGLMFKLRPPRHINWLYGYRTKRSMASQEAWDAAHRMGGQMWTAIGVALLTLSVLAVLFLSADKVTVTCIVYGASFVGIIIPLVIIQYRLKKAVDK